MSLAYSKYLEEHFKNVYAAYDWIKTNIPEVLNGEDYEIQIRYNHDASKYDPEEYEAYDRYFYGKEKTPEIKKEFRLAWLHHIHHNPHHWQHWVLIRDEPDEGIVALDMPHEYIIEMISDWWSFSWKTGNLTEVFDWYNQHKDYMKLSDNTRKIVEEILDKIREKLEDAEED